MGLHGKAVPGHPNLQYWGPNEFIRARVWVPLELRATIGKTLLVKGLGTQCVAEAVRRSHAPLAVFHRMVDAARSPTFTLDSPLPRYLELEGVRTAHRVTEMMEELPAPVAAMQLAPITYEAAIELWVASKGTEPPARETVGVYRGHLKRLFDRLGHDLMGDVSEQDIIDHPAVLLAGKLTNKSVNNHMASIRAVFRVAKEKRRIASDPTAGTIHKLKIGDSRRKEFTPEQHAEIIANAKQANGPAIKYLWLLGATLGARIGELADATVSAVQQIGGIWVLNINLEFRRWYVCDDGTRARLPLKTTGSKRIVPIPGVALRAGFLDYVASVRTGDPDAALFPMFDANGFGKFSDPASDLCNEWLRDVCKIDAGPGVLTFHSYRHFVKTHLRGAVGDELQRKITGHAGSTVSEQYGSALLARMLAAIETHVPGAAA